MDRKLAAILAMDMVGFSRLMEADEEETLARQETHLSELVFPAVTQHRGRVFKTTGDGILAEFPSAVDAIECAAEIQRAMPERETGVPENKRIVFRIGVNVGDIVLQGDDVYGDGVNVAARIEPLADPGGICVSEGAFKAARNKVSVGFEDVGLQDLKNITEPVGVLRVLLDPESAGKKVGTGRLRKAAPFWRQPVYIAAAAVIVVLGGGLAVRDVVLGFPEESGRRTGAAVLGQPGEAGDPRTIAVLYLQDGSADGDLGYVADGLSEALMDELTRVPSLRVLSRNASMRFKDSELPRDSIAKVLGAGTIVSGSVDEAGEGIRVNVALTDGQSGAEFRRGAFQQPRDSLIQLRSQLAAEVAEYLRVWLRDEVELRQSVLETENVASWAMMQRGERARKDAEALLAQRDPEAMQAAFLMADSLLAEAETLDPTWPRPVMMRGQIGLRMAQLSASNPLEAADWLEVGFAHTERSLALDNLDAEALENRGMLSYVKWALSLEPDPARAARLLADSELDLEAAVALDPSLANAWYILSVVYSQKPDLVEAKIAAQRAYEEDAFLRAAQSILWALYATSYDLEQFPDAVQYCNEGQRRFPRSASFAECELWLLASRVMEPDVDRAWELLARMDELTLPQNQEFKHLEGSIVVGGVLARAGLLDSANAVWERSRGNPEIDPASELLGFEAVFRLQNGQEEEALQLVKTYLTASPEHRTGWRWTSHWWWRPIQDNPEFQRLVGGGL